MRFSCTAIGTVCALLLTATGAGATADAKSEVGEPLWEDTTLQLPALTPLAQITPPGGGQAAAGEAPLAACAARYHKALSEIRDGFARRVSVAHRFVHDADPELPGRWLFSGLSAFAMPTTVAGWSEDNKSCVAPVSRRARCRRVVEDVPRSPDRLANPQPTAEELRVLRSLAEFVKMRGAVRDRGKDRRPTWETQRVARELDAYLGQPAHPALCSGAIEVLDFYVGHLTGFRKYMKTIADLDAKARELARTRVAAANAAASPSPTAAVGPSAPVLPIGTAVSSYPEMILEAGAGLLPVEQITPIAAETTALAMLTRAAEAMSLEAIREQPPLQRDMVAAAFRVLEGGVYAEILLGRYRSLEGALLGMVEQIREAHTKSCTCAD